MMTPKIVKSVMGSCNRIAAIINPNIGHKNNQ
jgi:hypothetical protein